VLGLVHGWVVGAGGQVGSMAGEAFGDGFGAVHGGLQRKISVVHFTSGGNAAP